ncbi:unnamed protein product [Darwinula stevensoni]|uniref:PR domain zinc finger protein 10 n=1 Tax=Darwinula stevensoni TaxID=69355 RepID=A0A7R8WYG5_9CRUS|nr:unnamed protein product [Darwinula stevensoni]CAG0879387.1 unnamed protein product [Darwinula stevensoni]
MSRSPQPSNSSGDHEDYRIGERVDSPTLTSYASQCTSTTPCSFAPNREISSSSDSAASARVENSLPMRSAYVSSSNIIHTVDSNEEVVNSASVHSTSGHESLMTSGDSCEIVQIQESVEDLTNHHSVTEWGEGITDLRKEIRIREERENRKHLSEARSISRHFRSRMSLETQEYPSHSTNNHPAHQTMDDEAKDIKKESFFEISSDLLYLERVGEEDEVAVFAKKDIDKRIRFGPLEAGDESALSSARPDLILTVELDGASFIPVDTGRNEATRWMGLVRPAKAHSEQNLMVYQQGNNLYYITTRLIPEGRELKVGYSIPYAHRRSLHLLKPCGEEGMRPPRLLPKKDKVVHSSSNVSKSSVIKVEVETVRQSPEAAFQGKCASTGAGNHIGDRCKTCYKRFPTPERLQHHLIIHESDLPKPYKCGICHKRFLNLSALNVHSKMHFERFFQCPMCDTTLGHLTALKNHVKEHRHEDNLFHCPFCPRTYEAYQLIRKHIRGRHSGKCYVCPLCEKKFLGSDKLKNHMLRHSDLREFLCSLCGKQFKRKDKLMDHLKSAHDKKKEEMKESLQLRQLLTKKKQPLPKVGDPGYSEFIYKCEECRMGFKRRGMLVNHMNSRHPEKELDSIPELSAPILRTTRDYFCPHCDKVYKSSSKRKAHIMKKHPGHSVDVEAIDGKSMSEPAGNVALLPAKCEFCPRQYATKAKLLQHQRKHHPSLLNHNTQSSKEELTSSKYEMETSTTTVSHHLSSTNEPPPPYEGIHQKLETTNNSNDTCTSTISPLPALFISNQAILPGNSEVTLVTSHQGNLNTEQRDVLTQAMTEWNPMLTLDTNHLPEGVLYRVVGVHVEPPQELPVLKLEVLPPSTGPS